MSKRKIIATFFLFMLAACSGKSKDQLYTEGKKELEAKNPSAAIVLFKSALEKDQNFMEARYELAKAYLQSGKYEQAEKEFRKVFAQDPSRSPIRLDLARLYNRWNKPDAAIAEAQELLRGNPAHAEALEILGASYLQKQDFPAAEKALREALQAEPARTSAKLELAAVHAVSSRRESARQLIGEVVAQDPANVRGYVALATLELEEGNPEAALKLYRKAAEADRTNSFVVYKAGLILVSQNQLDAAMSVADDLVNRFPDRGDGYRLRGIVRFQRGLYDEAVTALQYSLKLQPNVEGLYFLGLALNSRGDSESALSQFRRILDVNPQAPQPRLAIAGILLSQKRIDDAIQEVGKVLEKDSRNALAYNILGSAYILKGQAEEGMRYLNRATEIDPKIVDAHLKKGVLHLSKGRAREAETELMTAVRIAPDMLNSRLVLAGYYLRQNKPAQAVAALEKGLDGTKQDAVILNVLGALAFGRGDAKGGISYLERAKKANPSFLAPYMNLASYYGAQRNFDQALREYQVALSHDQKNIQAYTGMAAMWELKGKEKEAVASLQAAAKTGDPAGAMALASFYQRRKDYSRAVNVLDDARKAAPRNIDLIQYRGVLQMEAKNYRDALKSFDDLEQYQPDMAMSMKVKTYLQKGDVAKAMDQANRMITLHPRSASGYLLAAAIYEHSRDLPRAIEQAKKAIAVDLQSLDAHLALGTLYARKGDRQNALQAFDGALRKRQDYAPALLGQAMVLEQSGQREEAARKYRQILATSGSNVQALNNLAVLCADGFGPKQDALRLAISAFKLQPTSPAILDTLGYVLLKNGRVDDAVKALEKAAELMAGNGSVQYHLAMAYKAKGDRRRAADQIQKALRQGEFPEKAQALALQTELK